MEPALQAMLFDTAGTASCWKQGQTRSILSLSPLRAANDLHTLKTRCPLLAGTGLLLPYSEGLSGQNVTDYRDSVN